MLPSTNEDSGSRYLKWVFLKFPDISKLDQVFENNLRNKKNSSLSLFQGKLFQEKVA